MSFSEHGTPLAPSSGKGTSSPPVSFKLDYGYNATTVSFELDYGYNATTVSFELDYGYNATTVATSASDYFKDEYVAVAFVLFASLLSIGLCGNVLVIVIVSRMRKMKTPTNCYLMSLAVADCLVLVAAPLPAIPELFFATGRWIYGPVLCSLLVFLQYLAVNASSLTIAAFTLERYISICHPIKAQTLSRYARASKIVVGLWAFSLAYSAAWLYLATIGQSKLKSGELVDVCTFRLTRQQYTTIYMVDLLLFYCLPLVCACVLYGLIARTLFRRSDNFNGGQAGEAQRLRANGPRCALKRISRQSSGSAIAGGIDGKRAQHRTVRYVMTSSQRSIGEGTATARDIATTTQVVKMLIVVTVLFALLWMPYRVWVVYNSFVSSGNLFGSVWFSLFTRTLVFTNSAINPLLYSAFSNKFREAFVHYLTCRYLRKSRPWSSSRRRSNNVTTSSLLSEAPRRTSSVSA